MVERREDDGWLDSDEAGPEMRELVSRLRAGAPEAESRARIEAMVASTIAAPAATVSIAGATKAGFSLWKTLGVVIATAGVGGAIYVAVPSDPPAEPHAAATQTVAPPERTRAEPRVEETAPEPIEAAPAPIERAASTREPVAPAEVASNAAAPIEAAPAETARVEAPIEAPAEARIEAPVESASAPTSGPPPLAPSLDEAALLARARGAVRSNPRAALDDLHLHARSFPGGILGPERDVLMIEALLRSGRASEARAIADRFRRRDPASAHIRRIDYLFRTLEGPQ